MKLQIGKEIYASNTKTLDQQLQKLNFHAFFNRDVDGNMILPKPVVSL